MLGNLRQINFGENSESDDSEVLFDVPRQDRFETLKRTIVAVYRLATFPSDLPRKSVGMRLAALEDDRHTIEGMIRTVDMAALNELLRDLTLGRS